MNYFFLNNTLDQDPFVCYIKVLIFSKCYIFPPILQAELIYRPTARTVTRLVTYPEAPHHIVRVRVRPSVILRELDRIAYRSRPALTSSAVEDFYRSEATKVR